MASYDQKQRNEIVAKLLKQVVKRLPEQKELPVVPLALSRDLLESQPKTTEKRPVTKKVVRKTK